MGLCVDEGKLALSFKKRRELTKKNFECVCKEACDSEPGCLGYSTNANDDGNGLACRVYGKAFPGLVDRWLEMGSMSSPRYKGENIIGADGEKGMTCFKRTGSAFMQMEENSLHKWGGASPPQVSFLVRKFDTSEKLGWQRLQLARCREEQASVVSLLSQKGCMSAKESSGDSIMPNECQCHCPACNFWQLPPPVCHEPTVPPTSTVAPLPPGVVVVTGPPRAQTPPPMSVQIPLPPLPPLGNEFLPTLGPYQG